MPAEPTARRAETPSDPQPASLGWRFPPAFWSANVAELFERAAFYGMFIVLGVYLTRQIGFDDVATGYLTGMFGSILYLVPPFAGIMADKIGFRRSLLLAFALLTLGYALLGVAGLQSEGGPVFALAARRLISVTALAVLILGGATIKPVITGTVAVCSDDARRARAFSIFYAMVNIGAFSGKSLAAPVRQHLGLEYINFYAAAIALTALVFVAITLRDVPTVGRGKTLDEALRGLLRVVANLRFMALILIVSGFWAIQHQLYGAMPKYVLRLQGDAARPEWLANVNPFVVTLLVLPITHFVARWKAVSSIGVALLIIPISALTMALSPALSAAMGSNQVQLFGLALHVITLTMIIGIALQGIGECFLSPKWLEFASKQAPPGETGLYMGYMHLTSFFAYLIGLIMAGYLLDAYCPDPAKLPLEAQQQRRVAIETGAPLPPQYQHAHHIWYVFAGIGVAAFAGLMIFRLVTEATDRRRAVAPTR
jgi:dipeptide/tripeptide permease